MYKKWYVSRGLFFNKVKIHDENDKVIVKFGSSKEQEQLARLITHAVNTYFAMNNIKTEDDKNWNSAL